MPTIRPFTDADYEPAVAIENRLFPEYPNTAEEWRFWDERRDPEHRFARFVAVVDGTVAGSATMFQQSDMYHPRKFGIGLGVDPDWQGRGIGAALYDHIMHEIGQYDPISVRADAREDITRSLRFLQDRGFEEEFRVWESRLNPQTFDPAPFESYTRAAEQSGIQIKSLSELASDPDRNRKLYDMFVEVDADEPRPDAFTPWTFERFEQRILDNPNLLPDAYLIALDGDQYIGQAMLGKSQASDDLYTNLTGVRRAYRRRGIAMALKLATIAWAKANGTTVVKTWNESSNQPMLRINERLGYVRQPAWVNFIKRIGSEEPQTEGSNDQYQAV